MRLTRTIRYCLVAVSTFASAGIAQTADSLLVQVPVPSTEQDSAGSSREGSEDLSGGQGEVNYARLGIMAGITGAAIVGSYLYVKDVWWADQRSTFRFETTGENYAVGIDKLSHFWGGTFEADLFAWGFEWAGIRGKNSYLYGGIMSVVISLSVEATDGFAVEHGFSVRDYAAGVAGAFYPFLQQVVPALKPLNFKMSYWNHVPGYFEKQNELIEGNPTRSFLDNYGNQTYWATLNLYAISPSAWESWMPRWLNIAVGARAGDVVPVIRKDHQFMERQIYVSVDVEVAQLLPERGAFWVAMRRILPHFHFPAPALRVSPSVAFFGLYM